MGIVLLVVLLVPVIVLSIPQTYTELTFREVPGPGLTTILEPEYIEVTYIPLINVFQNSQFGPIDIAFMAGYVVLFGLAIWLILHSRRYRETQQAKQQSLNTTASPDLGTSGAV